MSGDTRSITHVSAIDMAVHSNQLRKYETAAEMARLVGDLDRWLTRRQRLDPRGQHKTQLTAVDDLVRGAVTELAARLEELSVDRPTGEFYQECRRFDKRVLWVRRIWQFFRDKFDQRDDPQLQPLLAAADEVVWSCYRQVFAIAEGYSVEIRQGAYPLAFVEPLWSPAAYPAVLVPDELADQDRVVGDEFIRRHLNSLPISAVRLPPVCIPAPWWLVFVGHEVGHHIQYDLLENAALVPLFQKQVEAAVRNQGGLEDEWNLWGAWSREIFADVFSILVMGPAAVTALEALEVATPSVMRTRRQLYPSPVVRLALLAYAATSCGLDGLGALWHGNPADLAKGDADAERDLTFVPAVVEAALGPLPGLPSPLDTHPYPLKILTGFIPTAFQQNGAVDRWQQVLRGLCPVPAQTDVRSAREVTSGAVQAWLEVAAEHLRLLATDGPGPDLDASRASLAAATLKQVVASHAPGERARPAVQPISADPGTVLAGRLLQVDVECIDQ